METKFHPIDIAEATETVHWFLRIFCLVRVKRHRSGGYTLTNKLVGSILLGATLFFVAFSFVVVGLYDNPGRTIGAIKVCNSMCYMFDLVITLYKASTGSDVNARKEVDNLAAIDEALDAHRRDTYRRDRFSINIIFFGTLAMRTTTLICSASCNIVRIGIVACLPFIMHYFIEFILDANFIYNIAKLKMYNYRMYEMKKQMYQFCSVSRVGDEGCESAKEVDHRKIKLCYLKMYEICKLFNESQGLQMLLAYARLIVGTIITISVAVKLTKINNFVLFMGPFASYGMDMAMMVALLKQATTILETSKELSLAVERALVNKYFGSERESAAWEEFVELVHRCPLVLTAYDFFTLDYSLLGATFGTMVTYTIILTQLS